MLTRLRELIHAHRLFSLPTKLVGLIDITCEPQNHDVRVRDVWTVAQVLCKMEKLLKGENDATK